jgi:hypothetical protein
VFCHAAGLPLGGAQEVASGWVWMMKVASGRIAHDFNGQRMTRRYASEACIG